MNNAEHPSSVMITFGNQDVEVLLDWYSLSRYAAFVQSTPKGLGGDRLGKFVSRKLSEVDSRGIEPDVVYDRNGCALW